MMAPRHRCDSPDTAPDSVSSASTTNEPSGNTSTFTQDHRQSLPDQNEQYVSEIDEYEIKNGNESVGNFNFLGRKNNGHAINSTANESIDTFLANQLNRLTFREREAINEEIHGIDVDRRYIEESGVIEETPELLAKSLDDLQTELEKLRSANSGVGQSAFAFNRSQELYGSSPEKGTCFNTNDFRIMFLRCERFDCKKAAKRICAYAELVYEIYGEFALQRLPKLSDHSDHEVAVIKKGNTQFLPVRDRAGRRVYLHFADDDWDHLSLETRMRIPAYLIFHLLSNDVNTQRRGLICIFFWHKCKLMDKKRVILRGVAQNRVAEAFPFRVGAGHYCFPNESPMHDIFVHALTRLSGYFLPHLRLHTGSAVECSYILESFGISTKHSPLNIATGELDVTNHLRWLKLCVAKEENPTLQKKLIDCPYHSDILSGRGQIVMNHPGNIMFRNFIQSKLEAYSNVRTKKESTQWTWGAVRILKNEYGARFLKEERIDGDITAWVEVSNEDARSKVRIAFRDARTRLAKISEKEGNSKSNGHSRTKATSSGGAMPSPTLIQSSSVLSKRKNDKTTESDGFFPLSSPSQQQEQSNMPFLHLGEINNKLGILNDNLSELNNNLSSLVNPPLVEADSSTSEFLGLDGTNHSKRQRLCSQGFFDCL